MSTTAPLTAGSLNHRKVTVAGYIHTHYKEAFTVSDLADRFSISHGHLTRLFKLFYGITPVEYMIEARINMAKKLIQTRPELRIKEIAALVGGTAPPAAPRPAPVDSGLRPAPAPVLACLGGLRRRPAARRR